MKFYRYGSAFGASALAIGLSATLLAAVVPIGARAQKGVMQKAARWPERTTILIGTAARPLFKQCSRPSPVAASFWTPTIADVQAAERTLFVFLQTRKSHNGANRSLRPNYRQYAGFVDKRSGHKCLYLNGIAPNIVDEAVRYPVPGKKPYDWKREPMVACDGGDGFWGAEYDAQTGKWSGFFLNGPF